MMMEMKIIEIKCWRIFEYYKHINIGYRGNSNNTLIKEKHNGVSIISGSIGNRTGLN